MQEIKRVFYLDNLKALLIALVLFHHAGQAYGPTGGYWDVQDASRWDLLGPFFAVNASFFMALFFFISAYFFASSYNRKGAKGFLRDKFIRLGIPVLAGLLIIVPLYQYFSFINFRGGANISVIQYFTDVFFGMGEKPALLFSPNWPEMNFGPFWFILHVLVYSCIYALYRKIKDILIKGKAGGNDESAACARRFPLLPVILIFTAVVTVVTVLIRTQYPIDRWEAILGFIQAEPAHLAVYIGMFMAGIFAQRYDLLGRIKRWEGNLLLSAGIIMAVIVYIVRAINGGYPQWLMGIYGFYEPAMGIFLCIGLLALAREGLNHHGKVWKFLSQNAYGVYILHVPAVILCQAALFNVQMGGSLKFLLSGSLAYVICNVIVYFARKVKPVRAVIG